MTIMNVTEEDLSVEIFDRENPRSLFNILPPRLQEAAIGVPRDKWLRSEAAITKSASPDFTDKCLRINFWQAYTKAQDSGKNINVNHVTSGVTTRNYFYHLIETEQDKLVYILTPPKAYDVMQRQILDESLEKLRHVVTSDIYDERVVTKTNSDGTQEHTKVRTINTKLVSEIRRITEMLQDRVHGTLVQKLAVRGQVDHKTPVQATKSGESAPEQGLDALLSSINAQLAELPETSVTPDPNLPPNSPHDVIEGELSE